MIDIRLREAITEVLEILKNVDNSYTEKLPDKFKRFLNDNKSTSDISKIDFSKELKDLNIRKETKELLGIMYLNYWCNEKKKNEYVKLLSTNEKKYQEELLEKYNPDNLFKKRTKQEETIEHTVTNEVAMVKYNESLFKKIWNKILSIFKK